MRAISRSLNLIWIQEAPTGTVNGSNVTFTVSQIPYSAANLSLYQDGIRLRNGVDYSIVLSTKTITMTAAPAAGQDLWAHYLRTN
jgi:hypothetical protein